MNYRLLSLLALTLFATACSSGKDDVEPGTGPVDATIVKTGTYMGLL